ncbi:TetR/AcrR family transcriptional regulator [Pontibacillus marinus]|uniref:TetR family transcriptional regulator n=1 Tax=Pontibacillus marinus BH030004 = DSM 16465 TaxID=1385511 RepID=A0A0A5GC57_9BACI|nr:TetR/AcrR family transcriptional regulator [Pontibacillus marinus]KGX90771.1 TetR family transcriptional regulator [Pontibacillus marinus BH030004 = DSM 16465]
MTDNSTWQTILNNTEILIKEKGCQKTTLKDIMERTELTKGGIYHYVKSKNELFAKLLTSKLEQVNQRFYEAAQNPAEEKLHSPLYQTTETFTFNSDSVSNEIILYLLSHRHDPSVAQLLEQHHKTVLEQSKEWIRYGQEHGAIPSNIDATNVSQLFLLIGYGLNVHHAITSDELGITQDKLFDYMFNMLSHD